MERREVISEGESQSHIAEAISQLWDYREYVRVNVLNWTTDIYMNHLDLKLKLLDSLETIVKSRLQVLTQSKDSMPLKYDKILQKCK